MQVDEYQTLRGYREARWTQLQFARLMGTTQPHVSEWESGARAPSLPTLYRMATLLEVDVHVLATAIYGEKPV